MVEIEGYEMPDELYYTKDHTWARVEDDGTVIVGIDAYGGTAAGEIEFIDLPLEDDEFHAGEAFGSMESAKWVGGLIMPTSGKVIEVNSDIEDNLEKLADDPYGEGWMIKVTPFNLEADMAGLYHGDALVEWFTKDLEERG
ncbi:MAG: glycine cleavage system protein H [Methanosarcinales archaeon]|nr:glycine cleavage system protein H [ANME-2 cluster archaeon]MDW7775978.1 glycine cleavage system protein H [Methanosarcinales archaeon]